MSGESLSSPIVESEGVAVLEFFALVATGLFDVLLFHAYKTDNERHNQAMWIIYGAIAWSALLSIVAIGVGFWLQSIFA